MNELRDIEAALEAVQAYLETPPRPGSVEDRRFLHLIEMVESHRASCPASPFADRLRRLGSRIDAMEKQREMERHSHDLVPGGEGTVGMLDWDFHRR